MATLPKPLFLLPSFSLSLADPKAFSFPKLDPAALLASYPHPFQPLLPDPKILYVRN